MVSSLRATWSTAGDVCHFGVTCIMTLPFRWQTISGCTLVVMIMPSRSSMGALKVYPWWFIPSPPHTKSSLHIFHLPEGSEHHGAPSTTSHEHSPHPGDRSRNIGSSISSGGKCSTDKVLLVFSNCVRWRQASRVRKCQSFNFTTCSWLSLTQLALLVSHRTMVISKRTRFMASVFLSMIRWVMMGRFSVVASVKDSISSLASSWLSLTPLALIVLYRVKRMSKREKSMALVSSSIFRWVLMSGCFWYSQVKRKLTIFFYSLSCGAYSGIYKRGRCHLSRPCIQRQ